ncbi:MAG: DUF58 domain-containing protein [Myxococcales bacterium]|nr:DUF58 domain-containing protein [Myxococcales bacterium]
MKRPGPRGRALLRTPIHEFPIYHQLVRTWEERLTPMGRRVLVTLSVLFALSLDTRRNQNFLLLAVALGMLVAAFVLVPRGRAEARLALVLPTRATAGEPLVVRGRVRVTEPAAGLLRVAFGQRFDERRLAVEPRELSLAFDGEEREATVQVLVRPVRRGRHALGPLTVRELDPLGLLAGRALAEVPATTVLVGPPVFEWALHDGNSGRRLSPGGIPFATHTSDAMELVGTREWRAGDRLRNVHYRSFARRGVPVVKEFQEEYFPRIAIVVDTSLPAPAGPAEREAFEAALSVGASVAAALARADHVVELLAAGPELYRVSAGRGLGQLDDVLDVLACIEPSDEPALAGVAPAVEAEIAQIGTVIVVLLDLDEARLACLDRLRVLGTEVHAIVVREGPTAVPLVESEGLERLPPSAVKRAIEGAR